MCSATSHHLLAAATGVTTSALVLSSKQECRKFVEIWQILIFFIDGCASVGISHFVIESIL